MRCRNKFGMTVCQICYNSVPETQSLSVILNLLQDLFKFTRWPDYFANVHWSRPYTVIAVSRILVYITSKYNLVSHPKGHVDIIIHLTFRLQVRLPAHFFISQISETIVPLPPGPFSNHISSLPSLVNFFGTSNSKYSVV